MKKSTQYYFPIAVFNQFTVGEKKVPFGLFGDGVEGVFFLFKNKKKANKFAQLNNSNNVAGMVIDEEDKSKKKTKGKKTDTKGKKPNRKKGTGSAGKGTIHDDDQKQEVNGARHLHWPAVTETR